MLQGIRRLPEVDLKCDNTAPSVQIGAGKENCAPPVDKCETSSSSLAPLLTLAQHGVSSIATDSDECISEPTELPINSSSRLKEEGKKTIYWYDQHPLHSLTFKSES